MSLVAVAFGTFSGLLDTNPTASNFPSPTREAVAKTLSPAGLTTYSVSLLATFAELNLLDTTEKEERFAAGEME